MSEDVNSSQQGPRRVGFSVRSPRDFWGGIVLIALAILAIWASRDLPGQRGFAFGPGTAPRLFSSMLAICGAAIALTGLLFDGPKIERYKIRGPLLVVIAIISFAAFVRPLGLVVASFLAFMLSILGSNEMKWVESIIAAALLTAGCVFLFNYMLGLPFQLWPAENAPALLLREVTDVISPLLSLFKR
jgi:putative tricarboxylic transport membrane protein